MRSQPPRTFGRVVLACLELPFQFFRTALLVTMMALARAFGAKVYIPKPEPRNLPAEVERKR